MMDKILIKEAVVVEGHYDVVALSEIIDGQIVATNGFGVFNDKELQTLIRQLAARQGVIIMTDSDTSGFKIRAFVAQMLPPEQVKHAYIPEISGKEKRKRTPSKSQMLGVEGTDKELLKNLIISASTTREKSENKFNHALFYRLGLSGTQESAKKRRALLTHLGLPTRLSTGAMIKILPSLITLEQLEDFAENSTK